MKVTKTALKDCFIIEPAVFFDERGCFFESYHHIKFTKYIGQEICWIQDNQSVSSKGVLRGLHYQRGKYQQAKLVRVIQGEVLDVIVDIRPDSKTYGQYIKEILNDRNQKQIFIPKGFAHGFLVLSNTAIFSYKCDNYYNKEAEGGIIYNDSELNIEWNLEGIENLIISDKDLSLPSFKHHLSICEF